MSKEGNTEERLAYRWETAGSHAGLIEETKTVVLWAEAGVRNFHSTSEDKALVWVKLVREAAPLAYGG